MRFLLDTNAVSAILRPARWPSRHRFMECMRQFASEDFGLSAIVVHEISYGAHRSAFPDEHLRNLAQLNFVRLDWSADDAMVAGKVRAELAAAGTPIGAYDTLIAGQALARNLTLITHNTREFSRVPGLKLEDWEA